MWCIGSSCCSDPTIDHQYKMYLLVLGKMHLRCVASWGFETFSVAIQINFMPSALLLISSKIYLLFYVLLPSLPSKLLSEAENSRCYWQPVTLFTSCIVYIFVVRAHQCCSVIHSFHHIIFSIVSIAG